MVAVAGVLGACHAVVAWRARHRVLADPSALAAQGWGAGEGDPIAVVLGAGLRPDGSPTNILARRVEAAAELYEAGIVDRLVMSGDDNTNGDQPQAMRHYATALGVPPDRIDIDRTGVDTAATCRTASARYPGATVVLVTQRFHARRTVYLARKTGLDAVVLIATGTNVRPRAMAKARVRELPAAVKAVVFDRV